MIDVAVGVVTRSDNRILIARRQKHADHGGYWEFPGGKVEAGEHPREALRRELREEIGIEVEHSKAWLRIRYNYPTRSVRLIVYRVAAWTGQAKGAEAQEIRWVDSLEIEGLKFPAANETIKRLLERP